MCRHERVAERAPRRRAAGALADRDLRRLGEHLDVGAEQRLERGRLRVPDVGLARELDGQRERLAQTQAIVACDHVHFELSDQRVGRHSGGERNDAKPGPRHGNLELRAALTDEHELRGRDRDVARARREERAAELRARQAALVGGQAARAQALGPEAVEGRRLPARARVGGVAHDHREHRLLVHEDLLAVERDLHLERGLGARGAGRERERREKRSDAIPHHVLPPGRARGLPSNSFVT